MTLCNICTTVITSRKPSLKCSGLCNNEYHVSCIYNGTVDLLGILNKINGLSWKCTECTERCSLINEHNLSEIIENKVANALSQISAQFELFKNEFFQKFPPTNSAAVDQPMKYSDVVRNKTEPAIIVKPKNPEQQNSQTRTDIMQQINPVDVNIQLSKIKNVKNGGLLISCKTKDENEKFKKLAAEKLPNTYEITEVHGLNPRIRIVGMKEELEEEELLNVIHAMNSNLIDSHSDCKLIKYYPTRKNNNVFQAIIQLNKTSYDRVMKAGNLFVGYESCTVYDAIDVYRCYNCNEFYHSSKYCKKSCTCPRCGEGHAVSNCKSNSLKCVNCVALKNKLKSEDICVDHASWDKNKCTAYIQALDRLRIDLLQCRQ